MKHAVLLGLTLLASACATDNVVSTDVPAFAETVGMGATGDAADDPAIWVHPSDVSRSLILGTNKDVGLYVYGLDGSEKQRLPVGLSNNVDLRGNIAVVSNDGVNALSWFRIEPSTATVSHAGDTRLTRIEPYGVCIGAPGGALQTAVTFKDGTIDIWTVGDTGSGLVTISGPRTIKLSSQLEGCVFDDEANRLFVGEENVALWAIDLATGAQAQVDKVNSGTGLVADVEGISLYLKPDGAGYLIVSAQGANRYVIYDRKPPHAAFGVIKIAPSADGKVDGASTTDGLDASSAALPGFPAGILVVQDDANPISEVDQNFKIVDWREVEKALGLK
ncbi:MAG: phytase [Hyphomonadaceae bacterium]|nr:phytase [Hyphomonadaceae bacterium]MBP9233616.1 phytase [Hyphomonadaceae bacterium]